MMKKTWARNSLWSPHVTSSKCVSNSLENLRPTQSFPHFFQWNVNQNFHRFNDDNLDWSSIPVSEPVSTMSPGTFKTKHKSICDEIVWITIRKLFRGLQLSFLFSRPTYNVMGETCLDKDQRRETTNVLAAMKWKGAESDTWCLQLLATGARKVPVDMVDTGSDAIAFRWDLKR